MPKRLIIPVLRIDSSLEKVGVNAMGEMAVPHNAAIPGWYQGGVKPGENGNAVIAGHKDTLFGMPGVFANLGKLQMGDIVSLEDESGELLHFRVTALRQFDPNMAPVHDIFGKATMPHLQLITCSGLWQSTLHAYDKRLVVFTELIP